MSVASRKCGVHMIQAPSIVTPANSILEEKAEMDSSRKSSETGPKNLDANKVEAFLDEHTDFLEDYVRRKVNRLRLEHWLFRRHSTNSTNNFLSPESSVISSSATTPRQRSRSFTPLRKLSATKFEESGLATPILSKTVDGQPSFLRTQPPPSSTMDSVVHYERTADKCDRKSDRKLTDRKELLLKLIPEILAAGDVGTWCYKIARALHRVFQSDWAELLILGRPNSFEGDLYQSEDLSDKMTKTRGSANRLVTGSITSGRILNVERPDLEFEGFRVEAALVGPLFCPRSRRVIGSVHMYKKIKTGFDDRCLNHFDDRSIFIHEKEYERNCNGFEHSTPAPASAAAAKFSREDEILFSHLLDFAGRSLTSVQAQQEMRLELSRSEVFLELARTVFREPSRLEPTMLTILTNFLSLIDCERCQILLSDVDHPNVFKRVFDLERKDLNPDGSCDRETPFEARFPINAIITGEVARTGKTINIRMDDDSTDCPGSLKSIFCMPIRDPDEKTLGVISLIDKDDGGEFTDNDARFVEAFAIFCGMAIRNAADYEKAVVSEAKLQVAFEVMNRFMTSTEGDAQDLSKQPVAAAATLTLDTFSFNYLNMDDTATLTASIRMFIDLGMLSRFNIDYLTLCRFLLTVKRNYRNETVKYHNWYHAFNVAQTMFVMLIKTGWNRMFSETDVLGLLVACICHDLDHRGTNNSFQIKTQNPLAKLYSSSTMERHHLNQCLLLLNLKGNNILEHLNEDEYSNTLSVIEKCILATDLSLHFQHVADISLLASSVASQSHLENLIAGSGASSGNSRFYLQSALMTAADLGAVTKPWAVHRTVSQLVAEEFWEQGDLEREELNEDPQPMMDRHASLSSVQLSFIDGVCTEVYQIMAKFSPHLQPLLDNCLENRSRWVQLEEKEQKDAEAQKEVARNL